MNNLPLSTDVTAFRFSTKAVTLEQLAPLVSQASLCDQIIVTAERWRDGADSLLEEIVHQFAPIPLAVRSSAQSEDGWENSNAGAHLSLINVEPTADATRAAIGRVFESYRHASTEDQVLVQPMVVGIALAGVVLTRDLDTGSPYYVVNYDDVTGRTDTVTGGAESMTLFIHRGRIDAMHSPRMRKLINSIVELEKITGSQELDVEFCITQDEDVYILQVRPLAARHQWQALSDNTVDNAIDNIREALSGRMTPIAGLAGNTTILGEMPDWNPAEIIGNAPRPLALSLYKYLITDRVWAQARSDMGYRMVNEPLVVDFCGRPYVDVRLSFNSFLPDGIDDGLAQRLVDHQFEILSENRNYHDKVEFEVAVTCRDLDFNRQRKRLREAGFNKSEIENFETALAAITAQALDAGKGEIQRLVGLCDRLLEDQNDIGGHPPLERLGALLDDCKVSGTLPFSILARHGFIAVQFLKSLVARDALSDDDAGRFMMGIHTVASDMVHDMHEAARNNINTGTLIAKYGHLRPGTYDILSPRYDEHPELYFGHTTRQPLEIPEPFKLSAKQKRGIGSLLDEYGYDVTPEVLLDYIVQSIKAREYAKFCFTRSISDCLEILSAWGKEVGLSRDDLSFVGIESFLGHAKMDEIQTVIAEKREAYKLTRAIRLPHLIVEEADIDVIRLPLGHPTFITAKAVTAKTKHLTTHDTPDIDGHIVLIESADPGFDWIFSHDILGLVTQYGGANSHMTIRCAEFGLPAAIGCGEQLFETLKKAPVIELNCTARKLSAH